MPEDTIGGAAATQPKVNPKSNGTSLLHVVDPMGYEVTLELVVWDKHIVANHPEMEKHLDLLEATLAQPQIIQKSAKCSDTFYYYKLTGRSIFRRDDLYLSVVVRRDETLKKGTVKTAHLLKSIRDGEVIWMKRN